MNKRKVGLVALSTFALSTMLSFSPGLISKVIGQGQFSATPKIGDGLNTTVFDTPNGKISVNLPEDMAAGDTLTGTVIADAAGQTPEEKDQNEDELNGYVIEIRKAAEPAPEEPPEQLAQAPQTPNYPQTPQYNPPVDEPCPPEDPKPPKYYPPITDKPPTDDYHPEGYPPGETKPPKHYPPTTHKPPKGKCPDEKPMTSSKPPHEPGQWRSSKGPDYKPSPGQWRTRKGPMRVGLKPTGTSTPPNFTIGLGKEPIDVVLVNKNGQPVSQKPVSFSSRPKPNGLPPGDCSIPNVGQCGKPINIKGPCDGRFGNTKVTCGGKPCTPLAEGPRGTVCKSPNNVVGPTNITFNEGNKTATGKFCNLKVKLSAGKTVLKKGESATVTVTVYGTEGLTGPVELRIENKSANVIDMEGGNVQVITIQPSQRSTWVPMKNFISRRL
jgi:hypothetical protein